MPGSTSSMSTSPYLETAVSAARAAGDLLRSHFGSALAVNEFAAHDIKLDLDVRSQELITRLLLERFPDHALYGEEGIAGNQQSDFQWIVDPIDGTVNYFYGIPHFCISIALREKGEIILGVIYDPMRDELWQVERGGTPTLNGKPSHVSTRNKLSDATLSIGFSKTQTTIAAGLPVLQYLYQPRAQMPPHGQRGARSRLRGLRPARCLYRIQREPVGRGRRQDPRRSRGR